MMMSYQDRIRQIAPGIDPRHVEAWMRCEHSTLDHLDPARFRREVMICLGCISAANDSDPELNEKLARSYGL